MIKSFSRKKIDKTSISEIIIESITEAIVSGELKKGEKIPTETELSEYFGVSRNTIREATKVLISLGILEIRRPEGTYVADGFNERIFNPLLYGLILEDGSSKSLLELRRVLEVGVAQLAVEHATAEDIAQIKAALTDFVRALNNLPLDSEVILNKDLAFHAAIERAAHNPLMLKICRIVSNLSIPSRRLTTEAIIKQQEIEFLIKTHTQMYEMIEAKDYKSVVHAVDMSYRWWREILEADK